MAKETENIGLLHNVIAQGTRIIGSIETNSDIRIDGSLDGDVKCTGKVVVGPQGAIKGNIDCQSADIFGNIDGKVITSDMLSLKSSAAIIGEIHTKSLSIEPGASFNGTCEMLSRPE